MKISDLTEAPVVSQEYHLQRKDSEESSYPSIETKKVASDRWRKALVGRWKTPYEFNLIFIDMKKEQASSIKWELPYGPYEIDDMSDRGFGIGDVNLIPSAVNMIYIKNEIVSGVGHLTPWILAHRFGHASLLCLKRSGFIETLYRGMVKLVKAGLVKVEYTTTIDTPGANPMNLIAGDRVTADPRKTRLVRYSIGNSPATPPMMYFNLDRPEDGYFDPGVRFSAQRCTFKSRDNLESPSEYIFELVAQYIVTGKITLNKSGDERGLVTKLEEDLNQACNDVLAMSVGKVFVF